MSTTNMELNNTYAKVDDDNGRKRFQDICLLVSADSER